MKRTFQTWKGLVAAAVVVGSGGTAMAQQQRGSEAQPNQPQMNQPQTNQQQGNQM